MAMNREERISRTQRQEDITVGIGAPAITEMQDSVPMFRKVGANVNLYIKIFSICFFEEGFPKSISLIIMIEPEWS